MADWTGRIGRRRIGTAVVLGVALGLPGVIEAAGCGTFETAEGRAGYRLLRQGNPAGEETIRWTTESPGMWMRVDAEATGQLPGQAYALTQTLEFDARSHTLGRYTLRARIGGQDQTIRATRRGDSLTIAIESPQGSFNKSFVETGDLFILDNLLVNHLAILGCRIAQGGFRPETLRVVVPQVGSIVPAAVVPQTPAADGSRTVELRIGAITETLRFDPAGRLASVDVPTQSLRYERIPEPSEAPSSAQAADRAADRARDAAIRTEPSMPTRMLFVERNVRFVSKKTELDGILTLPRGGQPIPYRTVLLVHAAGPLDRDETIGPNQPFLELAHALAVNGIASLRYDKRTLAAPETIDPATMTVQEEVIDDALAALDFLRSQTEVNAERIVIVGHDLGGSLAASIARANRRVAGLVILAGSLRPLDEITRDRFIRLRDLAREEGTLSPDDEATYARVLAQVDSVQAGILPDRSTVTGMTGLYLRDYRNRDRVADFLAFRGPVLILQGGKDHLSGPTDLDLWRASAEQAGKKNVTIREFPGLSHYFIPIAGRPGPTSLLAPGHVDPGVSEAIAAFVAGIR
jgi:dienelactone hydrolase